MVQTTMILLSQYLVTKQNKRFVQECFSSADNIQKRLVLLEIESFIIYDCHNFVGSFPFVILTILNNNYYTL